MNLSYWWFMIEVWFTFNWPTVAMISTISSVIVGAVVLHRRGVTDRLFNWFCVYCAGVSGVFLACLVWAERLPLDRALFVFAAIVVGEFLIAFFTKGRHPAEESCATAEGASTTHNEVHNDDER